MNIREMKAEYSALKKKKTVLVGLINQKDVEGADIEADEKSLSDLKAKISRLERSIERAEDALEDEEDAKEVDDENEDGDDEKSKPKSKTFGIVSEVGSGLNPAEGIARKVIATSLVKRLGISDARKTAVDRLGIRNGDRLIKDLTSAGQPVVAQDYRGFIDLVRAEAVVRQFARIEYMPKGNLTEPRQITGSTGSWINEGAPIPTSQMSLDIINFLWKKLAVFTYSTKEYLMYANFDAAGKITEDLARQIALFEDEAFLNSAAETNGTPIGLAGSVLSTNTFGSTGVDFASVYENLLRAESYIRQNNIKGELVWVMSTQTKLFLRSLITSLGIRVFENEIQGGTLNGHKIFDTTLVPSNLPNTLATPTDTVSPIYLVAKDYAVVADAGSYEVQEIDQGSFVTGGGVQINTAQSDIIAWKCANRVDFKMTLDNAIACINADGWNLGNFAASIGNTQTPSTSVSGASGTKNSGS
ncbi:hypothetical protein Gdia_0562 [Gluconacetobacter diazotrophicus PA1 5]|uniref:phage major capsid protein n=1 Tax=Gluconacetobacter diazotrophicus TaxID=33996 RepID=UPI000173B3E2|nr:phage major capsid protein [Gluconacetobacter diazotrophicus]ACI50355.1 hypothetical protein Gdia_0562 [Gluconacetobacter diazotrophicus PA1 5]